MLLDVPRNAKQRPRPHWPAIASGTPAHLSGTRELPVWPVYALFILYPAWWALGLTSIIWTAIAIPMAWHLLRRRRIRLPPGFALWILFLTWVFAGSLSLGLVAPGTLPNSGGLMGYAQRIILYLSATILFLYIGNLSERRLPRLTLVRLLAYLGIVTVLGGIAGILWPDVNFTSPVELLLPSSLESSKWVQDMVHPGFAQVQNVIGTLNARPKAPFEYTNIWGNNLSVLLIWVFVGWWAYGSRGGKWAAGLIAGAAVVPTVYSLNRGMWAGLMFALVYVAVRLTLRGRLLMLGALAVGLVAGLLVFAFTPLSSMVKERTANGHSDNIRSTLAVKSVEAAVSSPVLGYGSGRALRGSPSSIVVGRTPSCPQCGNSTVGSTGQLWLLLISHGFVGTALFFGFFAQALWRYRHDRSAIGIGGSLVVLLSFLFSTTYTAAGSPLSLTFLGLVLLWRNDMARGDVPPADKRIRRREPPPSREGARVISG